MSEKSKKTSPRLDRPFAPRVLARARKIASGYQIVIWFEDGAYYGQSVEFPGAMGDGKTPDACVESVREGLIGIIGDMIERGEVPPPPDRDSADRGLVRDAADFRVRTARALSDRRRAAGLSQAELARRSGLRSETINRLEKGRRIPDERTLQKIERAIAETVV